MSNLSEARLPPRVKFSPIAVTGGAEPRLTSGGKADPKLVKE